MIPSPSIALAMIARDCAADLDACLARHAAAVDEVVVVDTGSRDGTPEVARRRGARVLDFPWRDDFAAARNAGLDAVTAAWVLVLDPDERFAAADLPRLRALAEGPADAWIVFTRNYVGRPGPGRRSLAEADRAEATPGATHVFLSEKVRLWRRRDGVRFEGAVHEVVDFACLRAGLRMDVAPLVVHHDGSMDERSAAGKDARYVAIARREVEAGSLHPNLLAIVARAEWKTGRTDAALDLLRRAAEAVPQFGPAHALRAEILRSGGDVEGALAALVAGMRAAPFWRDLPAAAARLLLDLGDRASAAEFARAGLALHPGDEEFLELLRSTEG